MTTLPEYFGRRFCSKRLRRLSAVILLVSVSAYLLSAIQGVSTLMGSITGYDYRLCAVIVWLAFTAFTIYSGSPGVLLTDTIMFLVFLAAALVAVPFLIRAGGGWFGGTEALAHSDTMPGILSWAGSPDYLYPDGVSNTVWAVTYGIVWALVVAISPWQTSRYLMAKDEHVVLRSSVWSSHGRHGRDDRAVLCRRVRAQHQRRPPRQRGHDLGRHARAAAGHRHAAAHRHQRSRYLVGRRRFCR